MKVVADRKALLGAVALANRAGGNRHTLPILSGVRLEADGVLEVGGTDLELTARSVLACEASEAGTAIIPGKMLASALRSFDASQVAINAANGEVELESNGSRVTLKTQAADDYPAFPAQDEGEAIIFDALDLAMVLSQAMVAVSKDETRQVLCSVNVQVDGDQLTLAATDSYRLAVREIGVEGIAAFEVNLPGRFCAEAIKLCKQRKRAEVTLTIGKLQASLEVGDRRLTTRLVEGDFPKYRQLIPDKTAIIVTAPGGELSAAIKRVSLTAQNELPVKLALAEGELTVSAHTPDVGESSELVTSAAVEGDLVIAFKPAFLLDGLAACNSETVCMEANDALKPAMFSASGSDSFTYLLMPVRLS